MKVLSLNVGMPREVTWQGKVVATGIFKEPIQGRVMMRTLNLDGESASRSHRPRRREQGGLCLSIGTLQLLAKPNSLEWICPGECLEKTSHRGIS